MPIDDSPTDEQVAAAPTPLRPAGFWLRAVATLVDGGLVVMPADILAHFGWRADDAPLGAAMLYIVVPTLWAVICWARWAATPGKLLLGLVIVNADDQRRVPLTRLTARGVAGSVSLLVLGLGCFWVAFDRRKQAWHDKLTSTLVVRRANVDLRRRLLPLLLIGLGMCAAVGGWSWAWMRTHRAELRAQGKRIEAEARAYGRAHDGAGCTDEAFHRLDVCDGFLCRVAAGVFLRHCLHNTPLQTLDCADVPAKGRIVQSVAWQQQR